MTDAKDFRIFGLAPGSIWSGDGAILPGAPFGEPLGRLEKMPNFRTGGVMFRVVCTPEEERRWLELVAGFHEAETIAPGCQ